MGSKRTIFTRMAALVSAGSLALAGCGAVAGTDAGSVGNGSPATSAADPAVAQGPGYWGPGYWGPRMMNGSGWWGPGMMGHRYGLPGTGGQVTTLDQARQRATTFAEQLNLRVGEVMQFAWNFYAELTTSSGEPATEALVDPTSGAVGLEYGPAMMWNTTYGMHPTGPAQPRIAATQAHDIAQQWLRDHNGTLTVADPEPYPGYYTLHTLDNGKISGMLSVNAFTSAVWYHTWHGAYIASSQQ